MPSTGFTGPDMSMPTGYTGPTWMTPELLMPPVGFTGPTGPIAPIGPDMSLFPSAATGLVEPPHIATLDELMASHGAVVTKELADKRTLSVLKTNLRETLRPSLFQWACVGFPEIYIVQTFTIVPPPICSDGVARDMFTYLGYCLEMGLGDLISQIQSKVEGMQFSHSILGNTLRLHVSKV